MRGFSMIELMIVISIMALASLIVLPALTKTQTIDKLEKAAYKVKYDIAYTQTRSIGAGANNRFFVAFRSSNGTGVDVAGGTADCDYVCYEDKNGNGVPEYSAIDSVANEVLNDPTTKLPMMYRFRDTQSAAGGIFGQFIQGFQAQINPIVTPPSALVRSSFTFDKFGGPKALDANGVFQDLDAAKGNTVMLLLNDAQNNRCIITIYPLTAAMRIKKMP